MSPVGWVVGAWLAVFLLALGVAFYLEGHDG